jgi:hypothetical protein
VAVAYGAAPNISSASERIFRLGLCARAHQGRERSRGQGRSEEDVGAGHAVDVGDAGCDGPRLDCAEWRFAAVQHAHLTALDLARCEHLKHLGNGLGARGPEA